MYIKSPLIGQSYNYLCNNITCMHIPYSTSDTLIYNRPHVMWTFCFPLNVSFSYYKFLKIDLLKVKEETVSS